MTWRGQYGPFIFGGDVNGAVRMGEHPASPQRWSYRWTRLLLSRSVGIGVLYRVAVPQESEGC